MFSELAAAHENPARRRTALASFTLQAMLAAAALTYPLLHPDSLPRVLHPVFVPVSGDTVTASHAASTAHSSASAPVLPIAVSNRSISWGHAHDLPQSGWPQAPDLGFGPGPTGVIDSILSDHVQPPPRIAVQHQNIRRSVVMEGNLVHRVEPQYPFIAKQLHIEGTVVLKAFISRQGTIERVQVERGQEMLARAAIEAVLQWQYRPYYLNNEPIEVETEITVNFKLQ